MATCILKCKTCNKLKTVPSDTVTLTEHKSFGGIWTYAFKCNLCGRIETQRANSAGVAAMKAVGCKIFSYRLPRRPARTGPVISEEDISNFVDFMNTHDRLAAYAA